MSCDYIFSDLLYVLRPFQDNAHLYILKTFLRKLCGLTGLMNSDVVLSYRRLYQVSQLLNRFAVACIIISHTVYACKTLQSLGILALLIYIKLKARFIFLKYSFLLLEHLLIYSQLLEKCRYSLHFCSAGFNTGHNSCPLPCSLIQKFTWWKKLSFRKSAS